MLGEADRAQPPPIGPKSRVGGVFLFAPLALIAPSDQTPPVIDDDISDDCRIDEGRFRPIYDRSGAFERDFQHVYVEFFCVKHAVVLPEILDSKLHALPTSVNGTA